MSIPFSLNSNQVGFQRSLPDDQNAGARQDDGEGDDEDSWTTGRFGRTGAVRSEIMDFN